MIAAKACHAGYRVENHRLPGSAKLCYHEGATTNCLSKRDSGAAHAWPASRFWRGRRMDCPNCHTWNPDDKIVCWRCQATLPKPVEKRKQRPAVFLGLPFWAWVVLAAMVVVWLLSSSLLPHLVGR